MRRLAKIVGLLSVVLVLVFSGLLYAQKGGKPPSDSTTTVQPIPLTVTFYAFDSVGPTALRGHPGTGDVTYEDRLDGVDAYITREGNLWFHLDCARYPSQHIDLDFSTSNRVRSGDDEPIPYSEGDMRTFRISTWVAQEKVSLGEMQAGQTYTNYPVGVQFWTDVDQYAWNLQYDGLANQTVMANNSVNITVGSSANGRTWTLTPTPNPQHLGPAEMLFEKYYHRRPQPGGFLHYGTWVMPFKIVFEEMPH